MFSGCPMQSSVRLSVNTLRRDVFIPQYHSIRGLAYLYSTIVLYKSTFYLLTYYGRNTMFAMLSLYGNGFLSRGFTDRREILHGGSATSQTGFLLFCGIAAGMAEIWASTGVGV